MAPFLDTNILVYAWSNEEDKALVAQDIIGRPFVSSVQVLNEFVTVLRRKLGFDWDEVERAVADVVEVGQTLLPIELDTHIRALRLAERYRLQFYDGVIVATAIKAKCEVLLSEDMHHGLVIEDQLTIRNPFV